MQSYGMYRMIDTGFEIVISCVYESTDVLATSSLWFTIYKIGLIPFSSIILVFA